jgi:hypothetical protein
MIVNCAHAARTNARCDSSKASTIQGVPGTSDLPFRAFTIIPEPGQHEASSTANAVWVRAHPGFKSPSLRHPDQGLCAYGTEPLIRVNDHRRLQMDH